MNCDNTKIGLFKVNKWKKQDRKRKMHYNLVSTNRRKRNSFNEIKYNVRLVRRRHERNHHTNHHINFDSHVHTLHF